jgi:hypothetical protein
VLSIVAGRVSYWLFGRWVKRFTRKTKTQLDAITAETIEGPFIAAAVLIGIRYSLSTLSQVLLVCLKEIEKHHVRLANPVECKFSAE